MKVRTARWFLAPLRQLRTLRLMARQGPSLPYDVAWALTTLHTAPDDAAFLHAWTRENPHSTSGIQYDHWQELDPTEQQRRLRWLHRHGYSPVQLLGLDPGLIQSAGIHVLDWGRPSNTGGQHLSEHPHPPDGVCPGPTA